MSRNLNRVYNELRTKNPNATEGQLRQQAWVMNDREIFESSLGNSGLGSSAGGAGGGGRIPNSGDTSTNNYVVDDYVEDYFE